MVKKRQDIKPQVTCLVSLSGAGARYMYLFDSFSPHFRERLRNSEYNLCCACLQNREDFHQNDFKAIEEMESLAREQHGA